MLTTAPRLCIRRPSPTTTEFIVTTLPPQTLTLRVLRILLLALRVTLAVATLLVLHARWIHDYPSTALSKFWPPSFDAVLYSIHASSPGLVLSRIALYAPLPVLVPSALLLGYVLSLRVHTSESLLVLRGLGVQTSRSPSAYLGPGASPATRFIPTEKIRDIFVNEAFRGFEVRYYLIVVVEDETDVVVVFPDLLPRRDIVETVWRRARACLYEPGKTVEGS